MLFAYNPEVSGGNKIILAAGPFVSYGVGKIKGTNGNISETVKWSEAENNGLNRWDAGAKLLIGYQLGNGLIFNLNGDLGLTSVLQNTSAKVHHTAFGLTVGYRF